MSQNKGVRAALRGSALGVVLCAMGAQAQNIVPNSLQHNPMPTLARIADTGAPSGDAQLREFLAETQAFTAFFQQTVLTVEGELLSTGRGKVSILRPAHMRWKYEAPDVLELVSDGLNFWSYDATLEQATVMPLKQVMAETPLAFLLNQKPLEETFEVMEATHVDGVEWASLRLREAATSPAMIEIGFVDGTLHALRFTDQFEQVVQIRFELMDTNPALAPEDFAYQPVPGTDILGTPAE